MGTRVEWRVHATPVAVTAASTEGGAGGLATETLTLDVKGSVGAGNSSGQWAGTDIANWTAGVHTHVNAHSTGATISAADDNLVFVKHTGKIYDGSVTTGNNKYVGSTSTEVVVKVKTGSTDLFELRPGEGVVIPQPLAVMVAYSAVANDTAPAVQYMKLT